MPDLLGFTNGPTLYAYLHHNLLSAFDAYGLFEENYQADPTDHPIYDQDLEYFDTFHDKAEYGVFKGVLKGTAKLARFTRSSSKKAGPALQTLPKTIKQEALAIAEQTTKEATKKAGRKRFAPDINATGTHPVFRRDPVTEKITHDETFIPQTNPQNPNLWESVLQFDGLEVINIGTKY